MGRVDLVVVDVLAATKFDHLLVAKIHDKEKHDHSDSKEDSSAYNVVWGFVTKT